jgi:4-methylaminobutanoate oxidase (formaldehyde-forming)
MYGHRLEASLGMGYVSLDEPVTAEVLSAGGFDVEVAARRVPATLQLGPWYDPKRVRVGS